MNLKFGLQINVPFKYTTCTALRRGVFDRPTDRQPSDRLCPTVGVRPLVSDRQPSDRQSAEQERTNDEDVRKEEQGGEAGEVGEEAEEDELAGEKSMMPPPPPPPPPPTTPPPPPNDGLDHHHAVEKIGEEKEASRGGLKQRHVPASKREAKLAKLSQYQARYRRLWWGRDLQVDALVDPRMMMME